MLARLFRAVALLLFAGQAIVAQAHLHADGRWASAAAVLAQAELHSAPPQHRPADLADCPICRQVAHAGAYLASGPPSFTTPATDVLWSRPATLPRQLHGPRSHAWRSRAPPEMLPS